MNIFVTLDYELFLGNNTGSVENCLIKPMNALCEVAERHDFKYIIFVDAAYLLRMQQLKELFSEIEKQFNKVCQHVQFLAKSGHDIQLHFHPQWFYSTWNEDLRKWEMDKDHYKLSDMPFKEALHALQDAKELLDSLVGYKVSAFRAGGFCFESFPAFRGAFLDMGVIIDSSVLRKKFIETPVHSYDYRIVPSQQIYRFNDSIKEMDPDGSFTELSITSFNWAPFKYFMRIRPHRTNYSPSVVFSDGVRVSDGKTSLIKTIKDAISRRYYHASIDGEWSNLLELYYQEAIKENLDEIILIGHPKNASDVSIRNLDIFFKDHPNVKVLTTSDIL